MYMLLTAALLMNFATVNARGCIEGRKRLTGLRGRLESPGLNEDAICRWQISVPAEFRIVFYFISYDIEYCGNAECKGCSSIVLRDNANTPWNRICQNFMPEPVASNGSSLWVDFILTSEYYRSSFIAEYTTSKFTATVDLHETSSVVISSTNFPGKYPRNSYYGWSVVAPSGFRVKIQFSKFDIRSCTDKCSCDFLVVYDGPSNRSSVLGTYCNSNEPEALHTSSEHALLEFVSSPMMPGGYSTDNIGFKATVSKEIRLYMIVVPCVLGILIVSLLVGVIVFYLRRRRRSHALSAPAVKMSLLTEEDSVINTQISDVSECVDGSLQPVYRPTTQSYNE